MTGDRAVEAAVEEVADLLGKQIGLRPQSNLRSRLRRCIQNEAAARGMRVVEYVDGLAQRPGEFQSLVNQVTVQESGFYRHPEHFQVLARDILPTLSRPVRIWSAGCANGQEAYSLAMMLEEANAEGSVFATDLSTEALSRAAVATYSTRELAGLGPDRLQRHFTAGDNGWSARRHLRARVTTMQHNLMAPLPAPAVDCQVVFCRNVLIYFDPQSTRTFLDRVADAMPDAVVFLGAAETMWSSSDSFRTVRTGDSYYYTPAGAAMLRSTLSGTGVVPVRSAASATDMSPRPVFDAAVSPDQRCPAPGRPGPARPVDRPTATAAVTAITMAAVASTTTVTATTTAKRAAGNADEAAAAAAQDGQLALAAGDHRSAVVAFRRCAFLTPDDALAHLHLGLALEASGDHASARRAFATARRTVLQAASPSARSALGGYATDELIRMLDTKHKELAP